MRRVGYRLALGLLGVSVFAGLLVMDPAVFSLLPAGAVVLFTVVLIGAGAVRAWLRLRKRRRYPRR